jgi:hypothetical protein
MRRAATAGVWTKWRMVLVVGSGGGSASIYSSVVPIVIVARSRYRPTTTDTLSDQHSRLSHAHSKLAQPEHHAFHVLHVEQCVGAALVSESHLPRPSVHPKLTCCTSTFWLNFSLRTCIHVQVRSDTVLPRQGWGGAPRSRARTAVGLPRPHGCFRCQSWHADRGLGSTPRRIVCPSHRQRTFGDAGRVERDCRRVACTSRCPCHPTPHHHRAPTILPSSTHQSIFDRSHVREHAHVSTHT